MNLESGDAAGRIHAVCARYYLPRTDCAARCSEFVRTLIGNERRTASVDLVDMRDGPGTDSSSNTVWMDGRGRYLDMSAFAKAPPAAGQSSLVAMFNDTLFIKHPWRLIARRLHRWLDVLAASGQPAMAGVVHPSTDLLILDTHNPNRQHLSTFCFVANRPAFVLIRELLNTLPLHAEEQAPESVDRAWLEDAMQCYPVLRHLLHAHCLGPDNPLTWRPSAATVSVGLDLRTRKAVTVAVEYAITARVLKQQGMIVPINVDFRYRALSAWSRWLAERNA